MWSFFLILSFESVNKLLSRVRAVFLSVVIAKQKQLQQTQTTQWTNQKDKQIHVTDAKHETIVSMSGLVWFHFWLVEKGKLFFFTAEQSKAKLKQMQITFDSQLKTTLFWTWF